MKQFKNSFGLYENKELIYIKTGDNENREKYKKMLLPGMWGKIDT